ncbi:3-methyl-2-oxobutanoate hydroxymethyltransferase [Anaeromyxobacter sp. PSR-1]|uniref:3-methyl-2-oxobutanoate hydroxymethyltransferase n=1 Tax=unclassified Anaeromyxobacter TaxID=2620896 RepID=UPI0005E857E0|nr:3-methyl-2-oxobutanoate hydroxymethyltransferase [Anaeromyxobacter sp. PSR-1]GAO04102.1 3-methyl-2-oxobutanoate hydroxymethyltransferase [Anaeromyxobacter sp. PSR-1]
MSSHPPAPRKHVTIHELRRMKESGERIAMVTAYDATAARLVAAAGVDAVLVGDSLGMAVQGHESTLPVTLDQMVYHSAMVRRGLARGDGRAHLVTDMSFGSYQASADEAVKAAMRLVAEGGAEGVKLEGGAEFGEVIRRIVRAGVPVMGHIGLTPQSVHRMGGYVVQGKDSEKAQQILRDARALEAAGCYALVLECIPSELARIVTSQLRIPTVGIGAGPHCDGQVLVLNDLLGLDASFTPKFVKRFGEVGAAVEGAVGAYVGEVKARAFPDDAHSFHSSSVRLVPVERHPEEAEEEPPDAIGAPI